MILIFTFKIWLEWKKKTKKEKGEVSKDLIIRTNNFYYSTAETYQNPVNKSPQFILILLKADKPVIHMIQTLLAFTIWLHARVPTIPR